MILRDGGFIEHNDEFPFMAPDEGYQPVVNFNFKKPNDWATDIRKSYYIRFSEPPRFGWMTMHTTMGSDTARLRYAINPDGSRYLEPKEEIIPGRTLPPGVTESWTHE